MNVAAQILTDLSERGVRVRLDGPELKLKPKSLLDPATLANVKEHKAELIELCNRCDRCRELEAEGHITLICGACGWQHPKVRVISALGSRRLKIDAITAKTGLDLDAVYEQLGNLFDLGVLGTDPDGDYWIKER